MVTRVCRRSWIGRSGKSDASSQSPDQVVQYVYDFGNRWVRKVFNPGEVDEESTIFVYDGNQITLQFDKAGSGDMAATDLTHRYLWGTSVDQILADETVDDGSAEDVLWPLTDHLNTVRDLAVYDPQTDETTVTNHLVYNAFGELISGTNPTLFGFTARPFDPATGLQNNLHRWYDAAVGRWLSEDPIGFWAQDANLYRYVRNRPSSAVDALGLRINDMFDPNVQAWRWKIRDSRAIHNPYKYYGAFTMSSAYDKLLDATWDHDWTIVIVATTGDAKALYNPLFNTVKIAGSINGISLGTAIHETVHIYNDYHYYWVSSETDEAEAYTLDQMFGEKNTTLPLRNFEESVRAHGDFAELVRDWKGIWSLEHGLPRRVLAVSIMWGSQSRPGTGKDVTMTEAEFGFDFSCKKLRVAYEELLRSYHYPSGCLKCPANLPDYIR